MLFKVSQEAPCWLSRSQQVAGPKLSKAMKSSNFGITMLVDPNLQHASVSRQNRWISHYTSWHFERKLARVCSFPRSKLCVTQTLRQCFLKIWRYGFIKVPQCHPMWTEIVRAKSWQVSAWCHTWWSSWSTSIARQKTALAMIVSMQEPFRGLGCEFSGIQNGSRSSFISGTYLQRSFWGSKSILLRTICNFLLFLQDGEPGIQDSKLSWGCSQQALMPSMSCVKVTCTARSSNPSGVVP